VCVRLPLPLPEHWCTGPFFQGRAVDNRLRSSSHGAAGLAWQIQPVPVLMRECFNRRRISHAAQGRAEAEELRDELVAGSVISSWSSAATQVVAGQKELKGRIDSVKNTQKITDAMKLVAAAKVRRAQDAVVNGRPFAENLVKVWSVGRAHRGMHGRGARSCWGRCMGLTPVASAESLCLSMLSGSYTLRELERIHHMTFACRLRHEGAHILAVLIWALWSTNPLATLPGAVRRQPAAAHRGRGLAAHPDQASQDLPCRGRHRRPRPLRRLQQLRHQEGTAILALPPTSTITLTVTVPLVPTLTFMLVSVPKLNLNQHHTADLTSLLVFSCGAARACCR